jgi:hypothetical protein
MVSFAKVITPQDAEAIRSYMVTVSNDAKNAPPPPPGLGGPGGPGGPPAAAPAPAPAPALHQ